MVNWVVAKCEHAITEITESDVVLQGMLTRCSGGDPRAQWEFTAFCSSNRPAGMQIDRESTRTHSCRFVFALSWRGKSG